MSGAVDAQMMGRALELARRGIYSTSPNPRVGCVIVQNDNIIAEGWHVRAGEGHAEINAIGQLNHRDDAVGATVYVTLEPCSHHGRTGPCVDALLELQVSRVVVAMQDPNPLVSGRGLARLREAGITVDVGIGGDGAQALNPGFIRRIQGGMPWVRVKSAMSLDGRTAMASGESQWITGAEARADVQRLRAQSCAIITGVGTVLADDPALTVRPGSFAPLAEGQTWRQPLRVVVDSHLRTPHTAALFGSGGQVMIVTLSEDGDRRVLLEQVGAQVERVHADENGRVSLPAVMDMLAGRGCNEVLIEAGANLCGAVLQQGLVDEWLLYMAPCLLGSEGRPLVDWPMQSMAQKQGLEIVDIRAVGSDWRIRCRPSIGRA